MYVVCKPVGGCRGGGRIGPVRAAWLVFPVEFAGVGMRDPVGLADAGLIGGERAVGRLTNEEVGEEVVEEAVDGEGEARPGGTTSG